MCRRGWPHTSPLFGPFSAFPTELHPERAPPHLAQTKGPWARPRKAEEMENISPCWLRGLDLPSCERDGRVLEGSRKKCRRRRRHPPLPPLPPPEHTCRMARAQREMGVPTSPQHFSPSLHQRCWRAPISPVLGVSGREGSSRLGRAASPVPLEVILSTTYPAGMQSESWSHRRWSLHKFPALENSSGRGSRG